MKRKISNKLLAVVLVFCLVAVALSAAFRIAWRLGNRYPSWEYKAESYEALADDLEGVCILPEEEWFEGGKHSYWVYVDSRSFLGKPCGYHISGPAGTGFSIQCRPMHWLGTSIGDITPTTTYNGVALQVSKSAVKFNLDHRAYEISSNMEAGHEDDFQQMALAIAQGMIDSCNRG